MNTQTQQITTARLIRRGFSAQTFTLGTVRVVMPNGVASVDTGESSRDDVVGTVYRGVVIDSNRGRHLFNNFNLPQLVDFLNRWM